MQWMVGEFDWQSSDVLVHTTSFNFDATAWQVLAPLMVGGRVVLVPSVRLREPRELVRCMQTCGVTQLLAVPALLELLVEQAEFGELESLRYLYCGGEAFKASLARRAKQRLPHATLVNLYGPTEVTIDTTFHRVAEDVSTATVPIGLPLPNLRAYVVDDELSLLPVGVVGELVVAGEGLAWGYHGAPALTAARFVPDPFGEPAGRLYRTGDLVRRQRDGALEYVGRTDHQVKVRGFRIELEEIESRLLEHPAVARTVVVVREDVPGDRRLVAYVVTATEQMSVGALRTWLAERLPDYMVPSAFVTMAALPLTPNGKVDRRALPSPDWTSGETYVAPRTATERILAEIWQQVLGSERVGAHDDFFSLGGHSLLAVQLLRRVEDRTGVRVALATFFAHSTLEALAAQMAREVPEGEGPVVLLDPASRGPEVFMCHALSGTAGPYLQLARSLSDDFRVYGVQTPPGADYADVESQLAHYERAIREVQGSGPYRLGGWSAGGLIALELARRLEDASMPVEWVVLLDSYVPRPMEAGSAATDALVAWSRELIVWSGRDVELDVTTFDASSGDERVERIIRGLRAEGVLPEDVPDDHFFALARTYEANFRRAREIRLRRFGGRVVLVAASGRSRSSIDAWREVTPNLEVRRVESQHHDILSQQHVRAVSRALVDAVRLERIRVS
jgi:thioesterase domain-containing protein